MSSGQVQRGDIEIAQIAKEMRTEILKMVAAAKSGHPGGALGLADIFAVLYFDILNLDPTRPDWEDRDRLVVSNGHTSPVLYSAMALKGFFPVSELVNFRKFGHFLQGHPSSKYLKGIDHSSGSLGQGLSAAVGLALGAKLQNKSYRVFCSISDGECGEGMIWEAATLAAHRKAKVVAFMDHNGIQIDGFTKDVCNLRDLGDKFRAFGWRVSRVSGHDIKALREVFHKEAESQQEGPSMIICDTVLGKGVSFMENNPDWHGKAPGKDQLEIALKDISLMK